jgi:hypothetical protein
MAASIGGLLQIWFVDSQWQKVFRHTFDVLGDYLTYGLFSVGSLALTVRLASSQTNGDLDCVLVGLANGSEVGSVHPFIDGNARALNAYAQADQRCIQVNTTNWSNLFGSKKVYHNSSSVGKGRSHIDM